MKKKHLLFIFFVGVSYSLSAQCVATASTAGSSSSEAITGEAQWNSCTNAAASDNNRATAGFLLGAFSSVNTDYIKMENFGFSVPSGATICGIEVTLERRGQGIIIGSSIVDNIIKLAKNGSPVGSNYASGAAWTTSDGSTTYGGSSDLWGSSWTPLDINAAGFGCLFSAQMSSGVASVFLQAEIDYLQISVYYNNLAPLPIDLLNFDVTLLKEKKVAIDWTTASEQNNFYFEVQRSPNCIDWKSIKTIDGAGNSNQPVKYKSLDVEPLPGLSFYRLKQTDFDGKMDYSRIRSVNAGSSYDINIGLDPTINCITFNCEIDQDASIVLDIYDMNGRLVKQSLLQSIRKGIPYSTEITIADFNKGVYFYRAVINNKDVATGKLVKN
jgi:hypothetical protein